MKVKDKGLMIMCHVDLTEVPERRESRECARRNIQKDKILLFQN